MQANLLSISEFADFSGISRKALIFYDKNDILKPAEKNEKGYRFYTKRQIYTVSSIKLLQALNYSLDEIKDLVSNSETWDYAKIIEDQLGEIAKQKEQLEKMEKVLQHQQKLFNQPAPLLDRPIIKTEKIRRNITIDQTHLLRNLGLSDAFHIVIREYQSLPYFFEDGGVLIRKNAEGEWVVFFYHYQDEVCEEIESVVFYTKEISNSSFDSMETIDDLLSILSVTENIPLQETIYLEISFTEFIPINRDRLLFKYIIPIQNH
ncbi:MerR family transcriptional regulator [Candidatus Enterococcus clewellii]|uniref:HTH merR-type domain-containing protein n=1 Tax=Candidatus Enterococcus clewellii TaxID=1834193 RepID=A0A242K4K7_9ENTE|nr:MerR family transcriptional regulator [Enterococcus sp. 9E7_DIV0242]OTP14458.1 hypothetical protein A5888_002559 [Enterococcus sp. 9E7_DIV0242]